MTEEEIKAIVGQYFTSKSLFNLDDPKLVDVSRDRLLLDIVLNGKEGKRTELLGKKFMNTNEVINRIVNSTKVWYSISTGDKRPIIRSVLRFWLPPTRGLFKITQGRCTEPSFRQRRSSPQSHDHIHIWFPDFRP